MYSLMNQGVFIGVTDKCGWGVTYRSKEDSKASHRKGPSHGQQLLNAVTLRSSVVWLSACLYLCLFLSLLSLSVFWPASVSVSLSFYKHPRQLGLSESPFLVATFSLYAQESLKFLWDILLISRGSWTSLLSWMGCFNLEKKIPYKGRGDRRKRLSCHSVGALEALHRDWETAPPSSSSFAGWIAM